MKAVRVHQCGGPDALRYEDVTQPVPGAGEALVKLAVAGVNFIDVQHREGRYKLPDTFFDPLPEDELRAWDGSDEPAS